MAQFKVEVNPFLKMATIKTNINDCEYSFGLFYNELDEWNSFTLDGKDYDIHFLYDDEFSVSIYLLHSNYDNSCIVELTIKLNNK